MKDSAEFYFWETAEEIKEEIKSLSQEIEEFKNEIQDKIDA